MSKTVLVVDDEARLVNLVRAMQNDWPGGGGVGR